MGIQARPGSSSGLAALNAALGDRRARRRVNHHAAAAARRSTTIGTTTAGTMTRAFETAFTGRDAGACELVGTVDERLGYAVGGTLIDVVEAAPIVLADSDDKVTWSRRA